MFAPASALDKCAFRMTSARDKESKVFIPLKNVVHFSKAVVSDNKRRQSVNIIIINSWLLSRVQQLMISFTRHTTSFALESQSHPLPPPPHHLALYISMVIFFLRLFLFFKSFTFSARPQCPPKATKRVILPSLYTSYNLSYRSEPYISMYKFCILHYYMECRLD